MKLLWLLLVSGIVLCVATVSAQTHRPLTDPELARKFTGVYAVTSVGHNSTGCKELAPDQDRAKQAKYLAVQYIDGGEVMWTSEVFSVNATNHSSVQIDASNLSMTTDGHFELYYQKRVIDASLWVNESIPEDMIQISEGEDKGWLPFASPIWAILAIGLAGIRRNEGFVANL